MASQTKDWIGNAIAKTQVWQFNPPVTTSAPTWELTVNGKTIAYKSNGTSADAIAGMLTLWRACDEPEFQEITASMASTSTPVPQGTGANEEQAVYITGAPTGGTFALSWNGASNVTAAIPYNATASQVQAALQEVLAIGAGNVYVSGAGTQASPWVVEFIGLLAATEKQPLLLLTTNSLTGGTNPSVFIARIQPGVAPQESTTAGYFLLTGKPGVPFTVTSQITGSAAASISVTRESLSSPTVTIARTSSGRAAIAEVQSIYLGGTPTGGTFTLTFGGDTTTAIAYNAPASGAGSVQSALQALASIGAGNCTVIGSGTAASPWVVTFTGTLTGPQALITGSAANITGTNTVTVTRNQGGAASANEIQVVGYDFAWTTIETPSASTFVSNSNFALLFPGPANNMVLAGFIPWNATPAQMLSAMQTALGSLGTASSLYSITATVTTFTDDNGTPFRSRKAHYEWQIQYQGALADIDLPQAQIFPITPGFSGIVVDNATYGLTWASGVATSSVTLQISPRPSSGSPEFESAPVTGSVGLLVLEVDSQFNTYIDRPSGSVIQYTQQNGSPSGVDEIQTITLSAGTVSGTFTLTFGANTTTAIAYNAPPTGAGSVQAALGALASIGGTGNVGVTGPNGGPWVVTFEGAMASTAESLITGSGTSLGGDTITITEVAHGVTGASEVQTITLANLNGGTYTLSFNGQTTVAISTTATAATVQTDLQSLSTIGSGNVAVSGSAGGPYTATFQGTLADTVLPLLGSDNSNLLAVLVDVVAITGVTGGEFTLSYGSYTTPPIAYNDSAATVQTDLADLPSIGAGNVSVSGGFVSSISDTFLTITITLPLSQIQGDLACSNSTLTGMTSATSLYPTILCTADGPNFWDNVNNWYPTGLPQAYLPAGPDGLLATAVSGGALTANTYYYKITATNSNGETTPGAEVSGTSSGGNLTLNVSWNYVAHATGYKVYRGTVAGAENVLVATITSGYQTFFADAGGATTSASPPGANTAVGDDVWLQNSSVSISYNTPQDWLRINSWNEDASYTGNVGLPRWNKAGYAEYRPTSVKIGAPASGTLPLAIGQGFGAGSAFTYLDTGTYQISMVVSGTAVPTGSLPCLLWLGSNAASEIDLFRGTMGIAYYPDETAQVATIRQAYQTNIVSDSTLTIGVGCATIPTFDKNGGDTLLNTSVTTLNGKAGTLTHAAGGIGTLLDLEGTTYTSRSAGAIAALKIAGSGVFDRSQDSRALDIAAAPNFYSGASFLDPHGAVVLTGQSYLDFNLVECGIEDVTIVVGSNVTLRRTQN